MCAEPRVMHGFTLTFTHADGTPAVWTLGIFPDSVVALQPAEPSGANITLDRGDGRTSDFLVVQSVDRIKALMDECKQLDAEDETQ